MNLAYLIAAVGVLGFLGFAFAFFVMWRRYRTLLKSSTVKEGELAQKVYEAEVLHSVGEEIGYSLDAAKIIEIVSSSLDRLLPYSVISYLVDPATPGHKIKFWCKVKEPVGPKYVLDIKLKMIAAYCEMMQKDIIETDVEDGVSGGVVQTSGNDVAGSFFNLPIVISGKVVAIINISSIQKNLYNESNTEVLYRMARQVSEAVSRVQDLIKNEKGKLSQALESLSDGVLMMDANMKLIIANNTLKKMLGLPDHPTTLDVFSKLDGRLDLRTMVETATKSDSTLEKKEIVVSNRDLEIVASRVVSQKNGQPIGVVVSFYDATDSKNLAKLRSEFMALMVHELRAPLTTIKSTVEYIKEEGLASFKEDEIEHHLNVIESTSQAMLELVGGLLDVAKIEAGKFDVICEPGDLAIAIADEVDSFKPLAEEKKLKLELKMESDLPLAFFDRVRIRQVLSNLLSNAIKYTDSGGVTIRVVKEVVNGQPMDILVSVADTGIGIADGGITKLFSKFGQLESGRTKADGKSTGLGLFITHGIVQVMGGKIWAESAGAGLGSTFNFTVPLAREDQQKVSDGEHDIVFSTKRIARA
jgi:signal transduction histidine kinase